MLIQPQQPFNSEIQSVLEVLKTCTLGTPYEGLLYLVGGLLRDRELGLTKASDLDLVLEGDAIELARFLFSKGVSSHFPVLYPRFGTAMLSVVTANGECAVEFVSARSESYSSDSRKPEVQSASLAQDAFRRDFTINTLMENLHTGEMLDLTGHAREDLAKGVLRTPLDPKVTFFDDPLRMLRAVRFAAKLGFEIEEGTWEAIRAEAIRLRPPAIASERIREEFVKIAALPGANFRRGIELLKESNLLSEFLPEMLAMEGCSQGEWHLYDVWEHTLVALEALPNETNIAARLGLLWHDIGKPATRSEDERGIRFYGHPSIGAELSRTIMTRLKFSNDEIRDVTTLVDLHMRLGDYRPQWTDGTLKRLMRACGVHLDDLFTMTRCDQNACNIPADVMVSLPNLRARIDSLNAQTNVLKIDSPLNGLEIMKLLDVGQGSHLQEAKEFLINEIIEGRLPEGDKEAAGKELLRRNENNGK